MDVELFDSAQQAETLFLAPELLEAGRSGQSPAEPVAPWVDYALFDVPCHLVRGLRQKTLAACAIDCLTRGRAECGLHTGCGHSTIVTH